MEGEKTNKFKYFQPIFSTIILISKIIRNIYYLKLFNEALSNFNEIIADDINNPNYIYSPYSIDYTYKDGEINKDGPYRISNYLYQPQSLEEKFYIINNKDYIKNDYIIINTKFPEYNYDYFIVNKHTGDFQSTPNSQNIETTFKNAFYIEAIFGIIVGIIIELLTWINVCRVDKKEMKVGHKIINMIGLMPLSIFLMLMKIVLFSSMYKDIMEFLVNFREITYLNNAVYLRWSFLQKIKVHYSILTNRSWLMRDFSPVISYLVFMMILYGLLEGIINKMEIRFVKCWKGGIVVWWIGIWCIFLIPLFQYIKLMSMDIPFSELIVNPIKMIGEIKLEMSVNMVIGWGVINELGGTILSIVNEVVQLVINSYNQHLEYMERTAMINSFPSDRPRQRETNFVNINIAT